MINPLTGLFVFIERQFSPENLFEEIQTGSVLCEVAHSLYQHTHLEAPGKKGHSSPDVWQPS